MNKKRALIIAGTGSMISQFNMTNIEVLEELNYMIDVAFDIYHGNNIDEQEKARFKKELKDRNIDVHQIDFSRSFLNIFGHIKAYKQIDELRKNNHYDIVHAHMPISSFLTRLVFRKERKNGTKVMYTAHGFHFFKDAPFINWLLYYPIEYIASYWTDTLILINKEDYVLAKAKMHAKEVVYTPGIGVDVQRFSNAKANKTSVLKGINIPGNNFILLSVGELNNNKNQSLSIEALHKLNNKNISLLIVGTGEDEEKLQHLINEYNLQDNIKLLGYRKDVEKICKISDCFIHTPKREGLGMSPLEAMASGLPLIITNNRGARDFAKDEITGYCINDSVEELAEAINKMYEDKAFRKQCSKNNKEIVKKFSKEESKKVIEKVYKNVTKI